MKKRAVDSTTTGWAYSACTLIYGHLYFGILSLLLLCSVHSRDPKLLIRIVYMENVCNNYVDTQPHIYRSWQHTSTPAQTDKLRLLHGKFTKNIFIKCLPSIRKCCVNSVQLSSELSSQPTACWLYKWDRIARYNLCSADRADQRWNCTECLRSGRVQQNASVQAVSLMHRFIFSCFFLCSLR